MVAEVDACKERNVFEMWGVQRMRDLCKGLIEWWRRLQRFVMLICVEDSHDASYARFLSDKHPS